MFTSLETASAARDRLEEDLYGLMETQLDAFLSDVLAMAEGALTSPVLIAAGNPARKRGRPVSDPFAYTSVRSRWYAAVRLMATTGPGIMDDLLVNTMLASDMPLHAFTKVREILEESKNDGWTEYATKKALSAELITKRGKGEDVSSYRARIRMRARTSATYNFNNDQLVEFRKEGATHKRWHAVTDSRTRATHAEVHDEIVGVDQTFDVGGYPMLMPGDNAAPLEEVANCRCILLPANSPEDDLTDGFSEEAILEDVLDDELYASASAGTGPELNEQDENMSKQFWAGPICVEGVTTGDGREMGAGSLRWETPVPFRHVVEDNGAHDGAVVVGVIESITRQDDGLIWGEGFFDMESPHGLEAARLVGNGLTTGVSVDLDDVSFEVRLSDEALEEMEKEQEAFEEIFKDPEDEVEDSDTDDDADDEEEEDPDKNKVYEFKSGDERMIITDARIRAATLVAIPAFAEAHIAVLEGFEDEVEDVEEDEVEAAPASALVAGAAPIEPPSAWFTAPKLDGPTPLTITSDGHVYGHLATWDVCHVASPAGEGICVVAPSSPSNYARFHTGTVVTAEGESIATGKITMGTGHAGPKARPEQTAAHYDNTGAAVADIRAGEDAFGIWVAGALRPSVTDEQIRALRASPLSGDWRRVDGHLELHAALAVNVPGFPIPRPAGLVASGELMSLVASGTLTPTFEEDRSATSQGLTPSELSALKRMAAAQREHERNAIKQRVELSAAKMRVRSFLTSRKGA